ncbi:unnamed protein product [Macrosiphum euphorbiae]|uniref:Uncharacterized protein n=1 Tax=Macrosiphum euphorbiae TaxID=13131 RepID=A0AAV0XJK9_9HEMI|nr:unnamed protein product [Macrosiphum euphorbiae]
MAVATIKNITDELNAILVANLEGILANAENGNYEYYEDGGDRVMVILVEPLVFVLARITSSLSTGEPLTITEITDDNNCENSPGLVAPVENDMLKIKDNIMSVEELRLLKKSKSRTVVSRTVVRKLHAENAFHNDETGCPRGGNA